MMKLITTKQIELMCSFAEITYDNFVLMPEVQDLELSDKVYEAYPGLLFVLTNTNEERPYDIVNVDYSVEDISGYWDRIIMNPKPANEKEYIIKAYKIMQPGGILVSTISNGSLKHIDMYSKEFQKFLKEHNANIVKIDGVNIVKLLKNGEK